MMLLGIFVNNFLETNHSSYDKVFWYTKQISLYYKPIRYRRVTLWMKK